MELRPLCLACGDPGSAAYDRVPDFLCGSPGEYRYLSCPTCHLLWISPRPALPTLLALYERYYGSVQLTPEADPQASGVRAHARALVLAAHHGYPLQVRPTPGSVTKLAGAVLGWLPWVGRRARFGLGLMLPPYQAGGRLLDIGCGLGWYVRLLQGLGWDAIGVEADRGVAAAGRSRYGVRIIDGTVEEQRFPAASFDAIVARHSIEHVPDPRGMLLECRRLLKTGGWLGIATPNGRSLASRMFGPHWRGLSAPWHLHLFNPVSLRRLLRETGFNIVRLRSTAVSAHWIYCASRAIRRGTYRSDRPTGSSHVFHAVEAVMNVWARDLGEELEATARARQIGEPPDT